MAGYVSLKKETQMFDCKTQMLNDLLCGEKNFHFTFDVNIPRYVELTGKEQVIVSNSIKHIVQEGFDKIREKLIASDRKTRQTMLQAKKPVTSVKEAIGHPFTNDKTRNKHSLWLQYLVTPEGKEVMKKMEELGIFVFSKDESALSKGPNYSRYKFGFEKDGRFHYYYTSQLNKPKIERKDKPEWVKKVEAHVPANKVSGVIERIQQKAKAQRKSKDYVTDMFIKNGKF